MKISNPSWGKAYSVMADLLFPRRCPVCDKPAPAGMLICPNHRKTFVPISDPYCLCCGKPLAKDTAEKELCKTCQLHPHVFDMGRALYSYRDVASAIYKLKYQGRAEYGEYFGKEMGRRYRELVNSWGAELIVPVPLHPERQKTRGYNQAAEIAAALSEELGIPCNETLLLRGKNTVPQKTLGDSERRKNLQNAFKLQGNVVNYKTVLIIDDIYTTGSTIDACATVLKECGVSKIYFLAVASGKEN